MCSSSSTYNDSTSVSVAVPTGAAANDVIVAIASVDNNTATKTGETVGATENVSAILTLMVLAALKQDSWVGYFVYQFNSCKNDFIVVQHGRKRRFTNVRYQ